MAETIFSGEIPSPLGRYAKIPPSLDKAFESGGIDTGKDITRGELDALRAACSQSLSLCGERVELPQGITVERRFSGGTLEAYVLHPPAGGKFVVGSSTYPEAYIIQQDGKFYVHIDSGNRYASLRELVAQLPSLMRTTDSRMAEVVRARSEEIRTLGRDLCDAYRVLYEARRRGARGESLEDSWALESRAARSTITLEKFANLAKRIQSGPSPSADEVTSELDEIIAQATSLLNELQTRPYWSKWKEHASKSESIQDMPANLAQRAPMWYDWLYTDSVWGLLQIAATK